MVPLSKRTKTLEDLLTEINNSKRLHNIDAKGPGNLVGYDENLEYTRVPYAGTSRVRLNTGKRKAEINNKNTQPEKEGDQEL